MTVDYYLSLLPARLRWSARRRLTMLSAGDGSPRPLSAKVLEHPELLDQIRAALPNRTVAQLVPYETTERERDLALALDIPMYGADPRHHPLGTKSGCRELFARVGAPHPLGVEQIAGTGDAIAAIADLRARRPRIAQLVVKLNEGVSGRGNAIVDLAGLPAPGAPDELLRIGERLFAMALEDPTLDRRRVPPTAQRGRRHSRGAHHRRRPAQPERAAEHHARPARSRSSRRTISCSEARAGRATSAAAFPAEPGVREPDHGDRPAVGAELARSE